MGKFERGWVEVAEQNVERSFNTLSNDVYSNQIANSIKDKLKINNIEFTHSKWVGNESYDEAGDLDIYNNNKIQIGIELKFSKSSGSGTKANLGQNKFHEYIPEILGYELFDEQLGLKKKRYEKVESYLKMKIQTKSQYEKLLREIKKSDEEFIKEIAEITSPGQIKYAEYVADIANKNLNDINILVEDILESKHVKESKSSKKVYYCVIQFYQQPNQSIHF